MLPLYLSRIVSNMLGFVGPGFVKPSKIFQVICRNYCRSAENEEKIFKEKKKQHLRRRGIGTKKICQDKNCANVKVSRTAKKTSLKN